MLYYKARIVELADHPLNKIPYTPSEERVRVYRIPIEKSEITRPCPKGIIPHKIVRIYNNISLRF